MSDLNWICDERYRCIRELVWENLLLFEEVEKFGDAQNVLMRVDDRKEEADFGKFECECDNTSTIEFMSES